MRVELTPLVELDRQARATAAWARNVELDRVTTSFVDPFDKARRQARLLDEIAKLKLAIARVEEGLG